MQQEAADNGQRSSESKTSLEKISYIFEDSIPGQNPTFALTKNNLLIILLCISVYFIFGLAEDFINIILLGFLFGVAYGKLSQRFVDFWKRQNKSYKVVETETIVICVLQLLLCLLLPWLAHSCQAPSGRVTFDLRQVVDLLYGRNNIWLRITQIFLYVHMVYSIWGNFIDDKLFVKDMGRTGQKLLNYVLACVVVIMLLVTLVLFITTIAIELRNAGIFLVNSFESSYGCKFASPDDKTFQGTFCQEKIPENLKQFVPNIDRERLQSCKSQIREVELRYLGYELGLFEQNLCTGLNILEQVNPNFLQSINTETTSYAVTVLFSIFGVIIQLVLLLTNGVFKLTTFASIFIVTLSNYEHTTSHLHIFGKRKEDLVAQIAVIIKATFSIALEHLVFSIAFLEIIGFSSFNILLSILLSMVAFIPYVKPSFIMAIMVLVHMWVGCRYLTDSICGFVYWLVSEQIYSLNYSGVGLHKVVINLSVIFGIYQYGVAGILYGPLIIILFQSVYDELFR